MGKGTISGTIRFLCHIPFGACTFIGIQHFYYVIDNMEVLQAPPLGKKIFMREVLSGPIV
jgi:hypothetical protein